ncbi:MAG: 16S rRNA (adenine(1518)-N(6)/adenine(1519)-N(6))-dimethyltransferase RsmA [Geobacteraceae bacterium]|nr:16S rRNA (adenine(1518)-N(6)/adenine(1519)-N(6))-dimethyltransferase RsmA [Geobacteraceae bacterium]
MVNIRAKKSLGQNFLVDGNVISNIVKAADIRPQDMILEIGPGRGALTSRLVEGAARVVAVEWDRELAALLRKELGNHESLEILHGDILRVDFHQILPLSGKDRWKVVANLPYNISSQILFRFIDERALFSELLLMLQKEVGDRLLAPPSCKEYGVLTVLSRLYFDVEKVLPVKPSSFRPIPKVDSVVLRFRILPCPRTDVGDEAFFRRVVKASFSQRRKTLFNCLKSLEYLADEAALRQVFEHVGIDAGRRGETLSLEEFARLSKEMLAAVRG